MALTNEEITQIVSQVLNRIKADSQGVGDLEPVTVLTGIVSLPALRGLEVVSVPITLLSADAVAAAALATAAAAGANEVTMNVETLITLMETALENARQMNEESGQIIDAAIQVVGEYEGTALAALRGATARFNSIVETGDLVEETIAEFLRVVYIKDKALFAAVSEDGLYYNSWPTASLYLNEDRTEILKDKIYLIGKVLYIWNEEESSIVEISGGGSGSGFYDITRQHPLESGFYTKETAIAALESAEIKDENKLGLIITFEISPGKWIEYRYEGSSLAGFLSPTAWSRFGGGDGIKKISLFKGTTLQELIPDEQGNVNLEIPNNSVDETLDENSTNPVQNKTLAAEFKKLSGKYGSALQLNEIGSGDDKAYSLSLLDESGEVLSTSDMFTGGGGGSVSTTKIVLTRVTANPTVKNGDDVKLVYTYDQIDTQSGESTGNTGQALITVTRGASSFTIEKSLSAGVSDTVDVTKYLGVGSNTVRVRVSVGEGAEQQVAQISWTVSVVQLTLTSSYNYASVINRGDRITIPFALVGSGIKTLRCFVDKVDTEDRSISTSTANGSFLIDTTSLAHGSHSIQLVCELELSSGTIIRSNSIYFDIAIREEGNITPLVAARFDFPDGGVVLGDNRPYVSARQYENYSLQYAVYNPQETPTKVDVLTSDGLISSAYISFVQNSLVVRAMSSGESVCRIVCGSSIYYYNLRVSQSELDIVEPSDGLQLKLTALGRSNNDVNREEWKYQDFTTEFSGVKWGGDGWTGNTLRLTGGGRAVVKYRPLAQPSQGASNAFAFLIKYKVSEVTSDDSVVIRCIDDSGTGFVITSQEARMVTKGKSALAMKMAAGQTYEIGFVSYPKAGLNSSDHEKLNSEMVYLYIDGIASGSVERGTSDSIYQDNPKYIELGTEEGATLDVFLMRAYNTYLSDSQMLDCYIVDQDNVDDLLEKYRANDIVDANGVISVDSIPDDMRYVIVTGRQANGVATVLQAAVNNDKDPKYDVDEILCIKRSEPNLNFRLIGGCVRLQGTSSLAYPIKNYRIYLNSSKKVDGQLFLGCDSHGIGGTLQTKAKYSFRLPDQTGKKPAPVNCFCLKADFAESSSSHNTGMARLVNDVLKAANELTPVQKHVDPSFENDVRTTIDGEPCLLFYRATMDDTPVLVGKFNFNNDKSTEAVFGFLDIPGYHDQAWVTDKFAGVNPTECWEFLNNDYPMGMFQDDDFVATDETGYPNWLKVFESRFPDVNDEYEDGTREPVYLRRMVKWVKSTQNDVDKFKNELSEYFDVDYLCDYFTFTDVFGCVDQRVKNMMFGFWYNPDKDKMLCYPIFYDNDTILGVRNDGRLQYGWDIDENTVDQELSTADKTVYAYAGHGSVLWNNLRTQFTSELALAYKRIREKMTNEYIFNVFDNEQAGRFCERIYNLDAQYKYVRPKTLGIEVNQNGVVSNLKYSYLEAMQGNRKAHRNWWITNRMHLFDAKYSTGQYSLTDITWKGNSAAGATVKAVPARDFYFEFRREGTTMIHTKVTGGQEWSYAYGQVANIGTIFHLLGGIFMSKLDLSGWGGFTDVNLPNLPILEDLVMGVTGKSYTLTELVIGNKLPMLRSLDIRNYTKIASLDLSSCKRLEQIVASGCSSLSVLSFAEGAPITNIVLPENYQTLMLRSMSKITREGVVFENKANITGLWVENCENLDGFALFEELRLSSNSKLRYVRIAGLDLEGDGNDLEAWYNANLGGIDASGNTVTGKCKLVGTYQLTSYLPDAVYNRYVNRFDELNLRQPEYTMIEFDDSVADDRNITNLDNNTGYKSGTQYIPSAHISKIMSQRRRCLGKLTAEDEMTIFPLHNSNSFFYANAANLSAAAPAKLDATEGDVWMDEPDYWYKGINDYLNNKKYSCFSSKIDMPSVPDTSLIKLSTLEQIQSAGNYTSRYKLLSGFSRVADSYSSDSNYSVCKVDVSGYKKVRFPTVLGTSLICSLFTSESGQILKNIIVPTLNNKFENGMYIIADIPSSAQYLYFTIHNNAEFDFVLLSNSNKIEDMEPDWVKHERCLTGVFEATAIGAKLYSAITGETNIASLSQSDMTYYATQRHLQLVDYEMHKDVGNLFFAQYGRRDAQAQCGYGQNTNARIIGEIAQIGMQDTINQNDAIEFAWYKGLDALGEETLIRTNSTVCLGYMNWFGNKAEWMANVGIPNLIAADSLKWYIVMPDGSTRKVKGTSSGTFCQGVHHQKYMDLIFVGAGTASGTTYYCDYFAGSTATSRVVYRSYSSASAHGGVSFSNGASDSSSTSAYIGSRLAFRGKIVVAQSVATYKAIQAIA